jgi:hypothetical protein
MKAESVSDVSDVSLPAENERRTSSAVNGEDHTCVQCRGNVDGTEQPVAVSGRTIWLHRECERFWLRAVQAGSDDRARR